MPTSDIPAEYQYTPLEQALFEALQFKIREVESFLAIRGRGSRAMRKWREFHEHQDKES